MNRDKAMQELASLVEVYKSLRENGKKLRDCLNRNQALQEQYIANIYELTETMNEYLIDAQHIMNAVEDDND